VRLAGFSRCQSVDAAEFPEDVRTIEDAAAPQSSLAFMFWGEGLFVFPLMLFYTAISYSIFSSLRKNREI
jgi:cytochrome bd-type quinol oxidase subunit 2